MTRRSAWPAGPAPEDSGGPLPSRAGAGPPRTPRDPVERARAIGLRLLTGSPRTRDELERALREREIPPEAVTAVLDRFEEAGLIDDAAFAEAWVESRHHGRGLAGRALARELRTRGVDSAVIDRAVGRLDRDTEEATARALVRRRLPATAGLPAPKRLRRLASLLARRGYGEELALRVVRSELAAEERDGPEGP